MRRRVLVFKRITKNYKKQRCFLQSMTHIDNLLNAGEFLYKGLAEPLTKAGIHFPYEQAAKVGDAAITLAAEATVFGMVCVAELYLSPQKRLAKTLIDGMRE